MHVDNRPYNYEHDVQIKFINYFIYKFLNLLTDYICSSVTDLLADVM